VVGRWLHALNLPEDDIPLVHKAATSWDVLDALGTAFISEELAASANVAQLGDENILVLTRRK
jgi:hypothetical protein